MNSSSSLADDYHVGSEIGRGRFGVVYHCTLRATGRPFAVKSVDRSTISDDLDRHGSDLEPKLAHLAGAGNPGVVQVHAVYEDGPWIHTVMDFCSGPDLLDMIRLRHGAPVPEPEAASVVSQLAAALVACHRRGVAHRDVKPENVLFAGDGRALLADFGCAACCGGGRRMTGVVGTSLYVAPEVLAGGEYDEKVDVWSLGVVTYLMLSGGVAPFSGETAEETFKAVVRGNLRFPTRLFSQVSPAAKDLMRRMMNRNAFGRFSADQILGHPWIVSGGGLRPLEQ